MTVLETEGISRRFGSLSALSEVSIRLERGNIYAFLGPNGAGKTTLIRIVLGLIRADGGEIRLFGRRFRDVPRTALGRIGYLVEAPSAYRHLTGRENLDIRRRMLGLPKAAIDRALAVVGLAEAANRVVKTYSLGMRQRLGLAQAIIASPELLILDEPTNGLDPAGIREIRDLLRRMPAEYGTTVFLSSHLLSEVEQVATHIGILSRGRVLFEGTKAELQTAREERLRIRCDREQEAVGILRRGGWQASVNGDGIVVDNAAGLAPCINRKLVESGFAIHQLGYERASLEDLFLQVTEAA